MENMKLKTPDNIKIELNHFKTGHNAVVILIHGWFMTKDSKSFSNLAHALSTDFDVISFDCRGHGKSSGFYTFTTKETIDVKTVVDYAKCEYEKIYLMGFSLGGALALIQGALEKDVDKVIAVSAPYSFEKIENQMWKKEAWGETFRKFEPLRWLSIRPSLIIRPKIRPIDIVDKITVPTLFIAGEKDPTVHPWHTKSLYKKANCTKQYELFKNCSHAEDLFDHEPKKFLKICSDFLLL